MRVIFNEIKKIFNIKSLMVLAIISFIIYNIFVKFWIDNFQIGKPDRNMYEISKILVAEGETRDTKEILEELKAKYTKDFDAYIEGNKVAQELGIKNSEELSRRTDECYKEGEFDKRIDEIYSNSGELMWNSQAINLIINNYNNKDIFYKQDYLGEGANRKLKEISMSNEYNDVLYERVFSNFNIFIFNCAVLIVVSVIFLVSPIFTKDEHTGIEYLQYSSKRGRRIFKDKVLVAIITSLVVVTLELAILLTLFLLKNGDIQVFYNSNINSWMNNSPIWYNMNLKEYMILSCVIIYGLAIGVTLITSFISRVCNRYITLIGFSLILTLVLFKVITNDGIMWNGIGSVYIQKFYVEGLILTLLVGGVAVLYTRYKKEKLKAIV